MLNVFNKNNEQKTLLELDDIKKIDINDIFAVSEGYTILHKKVIKIANYYDVYLCILKENGFFSTSDETLGYFNKNISDMVLYGCFDSVTEWYVDDVGYLAMSGSMIHKSRKNDTYKYTKIHFTFLDT